MIWKNLTSEEIVTRTDALIDRWQRVEDSVSEISLDDVTWENTMVPLIELDNYASFETNLIEFPQYTNPSKDIRDVSVEASKKISEFNVKSSMRKDIYERVKRVNTDNLDQESQLLQQRWVRDYERQGLNLDEEKRVQIEELFKKLSELSIEFNSNLGEENTKLTFTKEDLTGMSEDFINERIHEEDENNVTLTLKYPDVIPVMKLCDVQETRKIIMTAFQSRCINTNVTIIEKMVELRKRLAKLLGHSSFPDYILDVRMAKNSKNVKEFLYDLNIKLTPVLNKELKELKRLKKEHLKTTDDNQDDDFHLYDISYYCRINEENLCNIDQEKVKEYFPIDTVTKQLLNLYQDLLNLKFTEVESEKWHEDVSCYRVDDGTTGELVGHFYLDLHPREGKYAHAAEFSLRSGCSEHRPLVSLVCNFPKKTENSPGLLTHDDLVTFFHEFGHCMHEICSQTKYTTFAGTNVERDAVEAPSQMLENWCYETETLQRMSSHYKTGETIPVDMCDKIKETKKVNVGYDNKRQLMFGIFDQILHSEENTKTTVELLEQLHLSVLGVPMIPGTNFAGSFGHIAGGYESQYYGYMWSKVFSMDMYSSRFKNATDRNKVGLDYRREILEVGGTRGFMDSLTAFLGRKPNNEAFLEDMGLKL